MRTMDEAPALPPAALYEALEPYCSECGSTEVQIAAWVSIRPDGVVEVEDYCEPGALSEVCSECAAVGTVEWRARRPEEVEG